MSTARGASSIGRPVALQRCDRFVARTMNWLYDHLRFVSRHEPLIFADELDNRAEFPELDAWAFPRNALARSIWRRLTGIDVHPYALHCMRRHAPRILHSHFGYVAVSDYDLWKSLGVPWVVGFYGADVYSRRQQREWRKIYQGLFAACSRALALGPAMAHQLEQLGCPAEKVLVHPLGIDPTSLPEKLRHRADGETLRLLFAGTYREKKGLRYALEGAAHARAQGVDIKLHIVAEGSNKPGDAETQAQTMQLIRELRMEDIVACQPFLPFRELIALALRCHVFLAPSVTAADGDAEGTPFVLQQMMATAMPTIATAHSDIPYLFGDLAHLLVPERDATSIANRLQQYAAVPRLLLEHGAAMREQIIRNFDVRDCAARLSDVYDALA
jgi:colanic acid/amylovoran biosynthesis glycosyltransferase